MERTADLMGVRIEWLDDRYCEYKSEPTFLPSFKYQWKVTRAASIKSLLGASHCVQKKNRAGCMGVLVA